MTSVLLLTNSLACCHQRLIQWVLFIMCLLAIGGAFTWACLKLLQWQLWGETIMATNSLVKPRPSKSLTKYDSIMSTKAIIPFNQIYSDITLHVSPVPDFNHLNIHAQCFSTMPEQIQSSSSLSIIILLLRDCVCVFVFLCFYPTDFFLYCFVIKLIFNKQQLLAIT